MSTGCSADNSVLQGKSKRIPICYVIASMDTPRAGTERHLLQLISSLDREIFDPLLVVLRHSDWTLEFRDPDVPLKVLGMGSLWNPLSWYGIFRLALIMGQHRTEIAELYFVEGQFVGSIAARLARVPRVLAWRRDLAYQYGLKEKIMVRVTNPMVTRIVANSQAVRSKISITEGAPMERFEIIHNAIDLPTFDSQAEMDTTSEFEQFRQGKRIVCLTANLRPIKNIPCFLRAARQVADVCEDAGFLIMGGGDQAETLERYAAEQGLNDRILWAGSVAATAPYLKRCSVACLSSDSEGLPNAVMEYMAASLPVVATNVGGVPELVTDDVTGHLVERGDCDDMARHVIALLGDQGRCSSMGTAARVIVEGQFSRDRQMRAYEHLCLQGLQNSITGAESDANSSKRDVDENGGGQLKMRSSGASNK